MFTLLNRVFSRNRAKAPSKPFWPASFASFLCFSRKSCSKHLDIDRFIFCCMNSLRHLLMLCLRHFVTLSLRHFTKMLVQPCTIPSHPGATVHIRKMPSPNQMWGAPIVFAAFEYGLWGIGFGGSPIGYEGSLSRFKVQANFLQYYSVHPLTLSAGAAVDQRWTPKANTTYIQRSCAVVCIDVHVVHILP